MKIYITFGQSHSHKINGEIFDKNCIAEIDVLDYQEGRKLALELFGGEFSSTYAHEEVDDILEYYSRGIISV